MFHVEQYFKALKSAFIFNFSIDILAKIV